MSRRRRHRDEALYSRLPFQVWIVAGDTLGVAMRIARPIWPLLGRFLIQLHLNRAFGFIAVILNNSPLG